MKTVRYAARRSKPCPRAPVACSPVASPVDNFPEISTWLQIVPPLPINESVLYPGNKQTLTPVIFGKIGSSSRNRVFSA